MYFNLHLRFFWAGLLLACFPAVLASQNIPNNLFQFGTTDTCAYVPGQTFQRPSSWNAFQTTDSTRWGPIDSTCIPSYSIGNGNRAFVRAADLNGALPVYLNAALKSNGTTVPLDSNNLYKVSIAGAAWPGSMWNYGNNCREDFCTGAQIGIEIPDSAGTGTTTRWYNTAFTGNVSSEFCFPSEKFPQANAISRFWIKMSSDTATASPDSTGYFSVQVEDMSFSTEKIRALEASYNGFNWEVFLTQYQGNCPTFICPNKLLIYGDSTYPNANAISYVDITPQPNSNTQEQIDVILDFTTYLIAQPFVQLRGGLVQGDTLRHTYNLINNGGNICTYGFAELIFERGNNYTHRDGTVSFSDAQGCFMFGRSSSMILPPGSQMDYGQGSHGLLALRSGGNIELGTDAELTIYNQLVFGEYAGETDFEPMEIYLERGSRLTFAPGSQLSNALSLQPENCFLTVHMRGGTLDDQHLTPAERALIRRVYDRPSDLLADNVKIFGNPFSEALPVGVIGEGGEVVHMEVRDITGKWVAGREATLEPGLNDLRLEARDWAPGIYFLRIQMGEAVVTRRVSRVR